MDVLTTAQRSYNMSRIRASNTKPELQIKADLKKRGFTYQPKGVYGRPDFVNKREGIAIFVDGCFWHGCKKHYVAPKQNSTFWKTKINRNIERDKLVTRRLKEEGWQVVRLWEHQI